MRVLPMETKASQQDCETTWDWFEMVGLYLWLLCFDGDWTGRGLCEKKRKLEMDKIWDVRDRKEMICKIRHTNKKDQRTLNRNQV